VAEVGGAPLAGVVEAGGAPLAGVVELAGVDEAGVEAGSLLAADEGVVVVLEAGRAALAGVRSRRAFASPSDPASPSATTNPTAALLDTFGLIPGAMLEQVLEGRHGIGQHRLERLLAVDRPDPVRLVTS
jgi:hypothetical protein